VSDYVVVSDVGDTLKKLLWNHLRADPGIYSDIIASEDDITLLSPQEMEVGNSRKLSLFLYQITECPYLKNQEMERIDSGMLRSIPLPLVLSYLITPNTNDRKKDHILLGKVMQILYDNAIMKGSILQGTLAGTDDELHVVLYSLPFDEMVRLWQSFTEVSFKLSVCYQVTPVKIDSTREIEAKRVVKKEAVYYQMAVKRYK